MTSARRLVRLRCLIGVLALLCQWLTPLVHAQLWAASAGEPALAGFCGQLPPTLIQRTALRQLPPILQKYLADHDGANKLACPFCSTLHTAHLAGFSFHTWHLDAGSPPIPSTTAPCGAPLVQLVRLPPPRAPPSLLV